MRLSVIITCTRPWPDVRGCLERLLPQARTGDIEIIVADGSDGGLDPTAAAQVTWLRSPGRGPSAPRSQSDERCRATAKRSVTCFPR